jgi:hypothetical protein
MVFIVVVVQGVFLGESIVPLWPPAVAWWGRERFVFVMNVPHFLANVSRILIQDIRISII